jgi:hypothetical protein
MQVRYEARFANDATAVGNDYSVVHGAGSKAIGPKKKNTLCPLKFHYMCRSPIGSAEIFRAKV